MVKLDKRLTGANVIDTPLQEVLDACMSAREGSLSFGRCSTSCSGTISTRGTAR